MILLLVQVMMPKCSNAQIVSFSALFKAGCCKLEAEAAEAREARDGSMCTPSGKTEHHM